MPVERKGSSRCSFLQLQEGFFFCFFVFLFFCFFGQRASITDYAADGESREDGMGWNLLMRFLVRGCDGG